MIGRIDANTDDAEANVGEAHTQILKYKGSISANRPLIMKIFVTLWVFILLYGTLVR